MTAVKRKMHYFLLFLLLGYLFGLSGCAAEVPENCSMDLESVMTAIEQTGQLPDCYITKEEARKLGWKPSEGNLHEVAPGKAIGGDVFHNREGKLPDAPGRIWYEADLNYKGGHRGPERIVFSNDGLIYVTRDHYQTFERLK